MQKFTLPSFAFACRLTLTDARGRLWEISLSDLTVAMPMSSRVPLAAWCVNMLGET